jgi:WhiB family redox-sensing transcriptional regulator
MGFGAALCLPSVDLSFAYHFWYAFGMKEDRLYLDLIDAIKQAPTIPACQTSDPELWFAEKADPRSTTKAKELCKPCPVIKECLIYSLVSKQVYGVWGGLGPKERQKIRSQAGIRGGRNNPKPTYEWLR